MEKLWSKFEEQHDDKQIDIEIDIINELFFSSNTHMGQIKQSFNKWSMGALSSLAEQMYYISDSDEGVEQEYEFGEKDGYSYHPYREALIAQSISDTMWDVCKKKKKFF